MSTAKKPLPDGMEFNWWQLCHEKVKDAEQADQDGDRARAKSLRLSSAHDRRRLERAIGYMRAEGYDVEPLLLLVNDWPTTRLPDRAFTQWCVRQIGVGLRVATEALGVIVEKLAEEPSAVAS